LVITQDLGLYVKIAIEDQFKNKNHTLSMAAMCVQPKCLIESKSMSLSWWGLHVEWHIIEGFTL